MFIKVSKWVLIAAVVIQFIPFGRNHTNPSGPGACMEFTGHKGIDPPRLL